MRKFDQCLLACLVVVLFSSWAYAAPAGVNEAFLPACQNGDYAKVQQLLAQGADPNANGGMYKPIESAVHVGNLAMVQTLLAAGSRPNDGNSFHPVVLAVNMGNYPILEALLRSGGNPNAFDGRLKTGGTTALGLAKSKGRSDMVNLLTSFGAK